MAWSATDDFSAVNHYPVVRGPFEAAAKPGETVRIKANVSDPDGDTVDLAWRFFPVGTYEGEVAVVPDGNSCKVTIPSDAKSGQTIHILLRATDDGEPALVRYLRTVITVK
jgi:hypothetical protein